MTIHPPHTPLTAVSSSRSLRLFRTDRVTVVRTCLWVYFFLVIFEGALRKWFLPQLATPLLVARDPVCMIALFYGYPLLRKQMGVVFFVVLGLLAIPLAIGAGHGSAPVALFGSRILLLHFPLLFLFPMVFSRDDVWKIGRVLLWITIPMTVLLALQFYLPESHWVNVGVGGQGSSVFSGAAGRHRSSGTFSFTNGLTSFYALAGAMFAGWMVCGPRPWPKWLMVSGVCLALAMPLAISRSIAFQFAITAGFTVAAAGLSPKLLKTLVPAALGLTILILATSQTAVFQDALDPFTQRWEVATRVEGQGDGVSGVLENRVLEYGMLSAFDSIDSVPFWGHGIGMGTNTGARLLTGGRAFLIAESGWGAVIGELGPLLGLALIGYRGLIALALTLRSVRAVKLGNPLPFILGSYAIHAMFMGNTGQPTALGFIILGSGLMLAALREPPAATSAKHAPTEPAS